MEGKSNTPTWIPHLVSALSIAGITYATIRTEVPQVVRAEIKAELATIMPEVVHHVDSSVAAMDTAMVRRMKASTDSVVNRIGLIPVNVPDGTRVYRPQVIVHTDTAAHRALLHLIDSIGMAHQRTQNVVWELIETRPIPNGTESRWKRRKN